MPCIRLVRAILAAGVLALALVCANGPLAAQATDTLVPADTAAGVSEAIEVPQSPAQAYPPADPAGAASGLDAQPEPPRTLRAYWHVFIAFALVWLLLFGYVFFLARRFGRVERELATMTRAE